MEILAHWVPLANLSYALANKQLSIEANIKDTHQAASYNRFDHHLRSLTLRRYNRPHKVRSGQLQVLHRWVHVHAAAERRYSPEYSHLPGFFAKQMQAFSR